MADVKVSALTELSVPALEDLFYTVDNPSGTPASRKVVASRIGGLFDPGIADGRLTPTSGSPVNTAEVSSTTGLYYTPYVGNRISLYDGTRWKLYTFTERTLALGTVVDSTNYDVFIYDNAGTLTLEKLAWSSATARATALVRQDGVLCQSGALTRRYLGTFRTTSTSTTADTKARRFVWNTNHRVQRLLEITDSTDSWNYAVATWRQVRATAANAVSYVCGGGGSDGSVAEDLVVAYATLVTAAGDGNFVVGTGIGIDSTTVNSGVGGISNAGGGSTSCSPVTSRYYGIPGVGARTLYWLEYGGTAGYAASFGGDTAFSGTVGSTVVGTSGLRAVIWG